jgi:hypothetical protein
MLQQDWQLLEVEVSKEAVAVHVAQQAVREINVLE